MITEKREKQILMMSFFSGLAFAIVEFIFSIYSHSQSALTDAVYDASELGFLLPLAVSDCSAGFINLYRKSTHTVTIR